MYPRWWLESIGYWGAPFTTPAGREPTPVRPNSYPTLSSKEAYDSAYPNGLLETSYTNTCFTQPNNYSLSSIIFYLTLFFGGAIFTLVMQQFFPSNRKGYEQIPDRV